MESLIINKRDGKVSCLVYLLPVTNLRKKYTKNKQFIHSPISKTTQRGFKGFMGLWIKNPRVEWFRMGLCDPQQAKSGAGLGIKF